MPAFRALPSRDRRGSGIAPFASMMPSRWRRTRSAAMRMGCRSGVTGHRRLRTLPRAEAYSVVEVDLGTTNRLAALSLES